ncbi:MAG TPA: YggS family pyridoxal phosphate-dependent enzyme [Cellulomonadaceae bacterium]|nr:YggS family pyridoxal phosphate-dependent enzyme [Cellulomonadaceae bacterium]
MVDIDAARGIADRLAAVRVRVAESARAAGRDPGSVRVLLATKTQPLDLVRAAILAGGTLIGENRVQELVDKGPGLTDLSCDVHLIGHLQSNKVNQVLPWATCVQTVDSVDLARRLAARATDAGRVLDVMVQVNVSGEASKFGVPPESSRDLVARIAALPGLHLCGFMTVGARSPDAHVIRSGYARLRDIRDATVGSATAGTADAVELSMGMSEDLELAIAEGSTMVRVGTAVFGARPTP